MVCDDGDHAEDAVLMKENKMNLIDKYITEVGKHLPRKNRADIEAEIRSTLEDMLEERDHASPEDEAAVIALLMEYGSPRQVAESYVGPRYLIGPQMYPRVELVAKIVVSALFVGLLVAFGFSVINAGMSSLEFSKALVDFVLDYIGAAIGALGYVVLIFAVLERVLPKNDISGLDEKWEPEKLAQAPDPDSVKISERVVEIFFTIAFLVLFNFFSEYVGVYVFSNDRSVFIRVLTDIFFTYLPWWTLLGVLQIGFDFVLLRSGMWTTNTRVFSLALKAATLVLVVFMMMGPSVVAIPPESLAEISVEISAAQAETISRFVLIPFFLVVIITTVIESAQIIRRLMNRRGPAPFELQK
jgi:hypothetical protein